LLWIVTKSVIEDTTAGDVAEMLAAGTMRAHVPAKRSPEERLIGQPVGSKWSLRSSDLATLMIVASSGRPRGQCLVETLAAHLDATGRLAEVAGAGDNSQRPRDVGGIVIG
jgi:hypothetical protein